MTLKIDGYRSKPVWPRRYATAVNNGVLAGLFTEQEAVHEKGSMHRILFKRRRVQKRRDR